MNLRKEFERILAEALDESLATRGFSRDRLGFRREQRGYVEHYSFQPSRGNLNQIRCRYYLNVGLEFLSLSPAAVWAFLRENGTVSWLGERHVNLVYIREEIVWATRADELVTGAPEYWQIQPDSDLTLTKQQIVATINLCSEELPLLAKSLRGRVRKAWWLGWLVYPFIRRKLRPNKRLQATRSKQRAPEA